MSTTLEVEAAWAQSVWNNSYIKQYSPVVVAFEPVETSERDLSYLYHKGKVNFWTSLVTRNITYPIFSAGDKAQLRYSVRVNYTKEQDASGESYRDVRSAFETLISIVFSSLGSDWGSTVDYWIPDEDPLSIEEVEIAGAKCWRGTIVFTAEQYTSSF